MTNVPDLEIIEKEVTCILCDKGKATLSFQLKELPYLYKNDTVNLKCVVPVWTCNQPDNLCGLAWTDYRAEIIEEKTVNDFLTTKNS